jgi:hypothetical protein
MPKRKDVEKALKLYEDFRESKPRRGRVLDFDVPEAVMVMGNLVEVKYDTTRGRKTEKYHHTFKEGSRPLLCADATNGALYIIEGRYHVTSRGIVDIDARGNEIDD